MVGMLIRVAVIGGVYFVAREARAQQQDPTAPLACYEAATDEGLVSLSAKQLSLGASSIAPAQCYDIASDQLGFVDPNAVRLCQAATSTDPAACAAQLDAQTTLEEPAVVAYCAALAWPLVVSPSAGSPACIQAALDQTQLSDPQAAQLCTGSSSAGPVQCYLQGEDALVVSDDDLIDLCTQYVIAPIYPYGPYGTQAY